MGIENLNHLILMIKSWHDDACITSDGAYKLMNMIDFLMLKSTIIEKNNKFIKK
jgi:hypothetical protein